MHNQFRHKLRFPLLILSLLIANNTPALAQTSSAVQQDQIEKCITNKVALFRKQMGEGPLIRFDMLEEWRGECTGELARKSKPAQANTTPPASNTRQTSPQAYSQAIRVNVELECMLKGTRFYRNGALVNESKAPANTKPVFYKFDGQKLRVYHKEPNAPKASGDGARFIGRKTVVDEGKKFEISQFEKLAVMHEKIEFFFEPSAQGIKHITLISRFSDNEFASYGQFIFSCKE